MKSLFPKNKFIYYVLSWIPSLLIMIIIFSFSASVAEESDNTSGWLTNKVVHVVEMITGDDIAENTPSYDQINHYVRKTGHFLEYMALGCTFVLPYSLIIDRKLLVFILCELSSAFYACTDEFHQLFVAGRNGNFKDVLIDSMGAFVGISISLGICVILRKLSERGLKSRVLSE